MPVSIGTYITDIAAGKPRKAAPIASALQALADWANGNIVDADVKATAAIQESKFAFSTSTGHNHDGVTSRLLAMNRVKAYRSTSQAANNNTSTIISWSAAVYDADAFWSAGSPTRLTVPAGKGGFYMILVQVSMDYGAGDYRDATIRANGTTNIDSQIVFPTGAAGANNTIWAVSALEDLAAGDYIEVIVKQTSGGTLNVNPGTGVTNVRMIRLAA
jgi:hypothetical protein